MASTHHQTPLTLPVTNLPAATSFYLSALQPLGYRYISQVQHRLSAGSSSNAVGLGPENTSRVDLFLSQSQSGHTVSQTNNGKPAHVVFPAASRMAVRDYYSAALRAGGSPVVQPSTQPGGDGMFAAVVADYDGNKLEVCYCDSVPQAAAHSNGEHAPSVSGSQAGGSVQSWREGVAESHGRTSRGPSSYVKPEQSHAPPSAASAAPSRHSSTRRTSAQGTARPPSATGSASKSKAGNGPTSTIDVPGGKTVVGTILGAAAGAALAYKMVRSKQDSVQREDDFHSRLDARDRLKAEAREHSAMVDANVDNTPWRSKARSSTHRNNHLADRDSGYYSNTSHRDSSPVDGGIVRRSFTYPEPGNYGDGSSRRRSVSARPDDRRSATTTTRRLIEYPAPPDTTSAAPSKRPTTYRRGSYSDSGRSHSTVKPVAKALAPAPASSYSTRSAKYTAHSIAPPSPPPTLPLAAPSTRSRRDSQSSRASPPRHERAYSSHSYNNQQAPRSTTSHRSGPPPSSYIARPTESYHTAPASSGPRRRSTSSPQQPKRSVVYQAHAPAAPPSAALTAKALSSYSGQSEHRRTDSRFDDLESLTPDDSISNVPESDVRPPARSRSVRDSFAGRMASGRYPGADQGRGAGANRATNSPRMMGRSGVAAG